MQVVISNWGPSALFILFFLTPTTPASSFPSVFIYFLFFLNLFHPLLLHNQQQKISGFPHHVFNSMRVWLWCHLLFSVNFPPTLNVSCYRAQRSSVVYFPMMLSAMWLTPLRGEGNQPFHLQRRGNVEVLADSIFSSVVLTASEQSFTHSLFFFFFFTHVGHISNCALVHQDAFWNTCMC